MKTWLKPTPVVSPETEPFWAGCDRGQLLVQRCLRCKRFQFPYRRLCCHCWSVDSLEAIPASGRATVWTFSVIFRNDTPGFADDLPYVAALVELEEAGLKMMTNIIGCRPDEVVIGMPVEVTFVQAGPERMIPMFRPRGGVVGGH